MPQFVRPEDNVLARSLVLAGVHVVIGLVWLVSYAYFFSRVSDVLRRPRMRRASRALRERCSSDSAGDWRASAAETTRGWLRGGFTPIG